MDIALRALALYVFITLIMRVLGRRELSSLAPSDLVLLIVLGDTVQQGLTQDDYSVTGALIAVATIGGARISPKHANFIENAGGARSADAIALMVEARRRAHEQYGVELRHEVELLGPLELPPLDGATS